MKAFPFDSQITGYDEAGLPIYDRASDAADFARLLASFLCNGVFGEDMCEVLVASGMKVTVGTGSLLINGRYGYIEEPATVTLEGADTLPRIDTVVLRLDLSSAVNNIRVTYHKGAAAASPARPVLTRNGTVWELGLADVLVTANSTALAQKNVTDTRLNDSRCGLVAAILTDIDTTHLYDQIQAELAGFKNTQEADFERWFADLEAVLSGDVAANLAAELANKAEGIARTVSVAVSKWSTTAPYTATVTVTGVTANNAIVVSPAPASFEAYGNAGMRASAQAANTVTFTADVLPDTAISVNVLILNL